MDQLIDWQLIETLITPSKILRLCFLDFDGVMNNAEFYRQPDIIKRLKAKEHSDYMFDPISCELINRLAEETGMAICVSSDVRSDIVKGKKFLEAMQEIFAMNNITAPLVGLTPFIMPSKRGEEIEWVIKKVQELDCRLQYVIIDDYTKFILEAQKSYFVHCDTNYGFKDREYEQAKAILEREVL